MQGAFSVFLVFDIRFLVNVDSWNQDSPGKRSLSTNWEITMETRLHPIGALSLALGFAAAASSGSAQPARPWVDPPPEAGASAPSSVPAPAAPEAKAAAPQSSAPPASTAAVTDIDEKTKEPAQQRSEETSSAGERKPVTRRSATERRDRKPSREVTTAKSERQRQVNQRRDMAEQTMRSTRAARVREGLNSGLEVMTLRTIEFPDGRRVQILTKPRPGAMSELLGPPE